MSSLLLSRLVLVIVGLLIFVIQFAGGIGGSSEVAPAVDGFHRDDLKSSSPTPYHEHQTDDQQGHHSSPSSACSWAKSPNLSAFLS